MRYAVYVNDEERVGNGDKSTWDEVVYEMSELLRMGYFEVEQVYEIRDYM